QDRRYRLHHDLLGVVDPVDDDPESLAADLADDDEAALAGIVFRHRATEHGREVHQWQEAVTETEHRRIADALDLLAPGQHQLGDGDLRYREALSGRLDDESGDDRQSQRDLDEE